MPSVKMLVLVLLLSATLGSAQQDRAQHQPNLINVTYYPTPPTNPQAQQRQTRRVAREDSLDTSPSITSVHQVWTSSSSGRLDELSPEIISKLRNDVPFLAAYALRPRLVGAVSGQEQSQSNAGAMPSLDVGASSPQVARLTAGSESLVPKLGDFSEFKVETSSLSKSEHHHKRKTSLKRQKDGDHANPAASSTRKRRLEDARGRDSLGQLVKKMKQRQETANRSKSVTRRRSSPRRSRRSRSKLSGNKRQKMQKLSSRTERRRQNSRLAQDDVQLSSENDLSEVKGSDKREGEVKGGGPTGSKKPPFFAAAQPKSKPAEKEPSEQPNSSSTSNNGDEDDDDLEIDDESESKPKRVGDDDVEQDGDTVFVEPKSDGVEDDPPLPDEDPNAIDEVAPESQDKEAGGREKEEPTSSSSTPLAPEGDPRGNRVNRHKPGSDLPRPGQAEGAARDEENDDEDEGGNAGSGQTAGAGIGATFGGNADNGPQGPADPSNEDAPSGGEFGSRESGLEARGRVRPGVEFAHENDGDKKSPSSHSEGDFGERRHGDRAGGGLSGSAGRDDDSDEDDGGRGGRESSSTSPPTVHNDDDDLDYRDEMAERKGAKDSSPGHAGGSPSSTGVNSTTGQNHHHQSKDDHCDDGSHNHHGGHHDTIEWLRGAIPGEPDDDYPVLSRVNSTDFRCGDQKYAGYYADVSSRCQIFHICQMDGRQDSFL